MVLQMFSRWHTQSKSTACLIPCRRRLRFWGTTPQMTMPKQEHCRRCRSSWSQLTMPMVSLCATHMTANRILLCSLT